MLKMFYISFLLLCVVVKVFSVEPAINLSQCNSDDDICVTTALKVIYPLILQPNKAIGAEDMDPMYQEFVEGNLTTLKYDLTKSTVIGFQRCEVRSAMFPNKNLQHLHATLICNFVMRGQYDMQGQLLDYPVFGDGDYVVTVDKYILELDLYMKPIKKDGKTYNNIHSFKVEADPVEKVTYDFTNLYNGNKEMAAAFLSFINEHWREATLEIQDPAVYANVGKVVNNFNKYLQTIAI